MVDLDGSNQSIAQLDEDESENLPQRSVLQPRTDEETVEESDTENEQSDLVRFKIRKIYP